VKVTKENVTLLNYAYFYMKMYTVFLRHHLTVSLTYLSWVVMFCRYGTLPYNL